MSDLDAAATPLALVFGDAGASEHLRAMLTEIGAHVVYDVEIGELDTAALSESGAKVVLVNLDDAVEQRLDQLYANLEEGGYRVVFNEPASSAALSGWDHARWARHLGAKLRDDIDVDPPRPANAEPVPAAPVVANDAWMADALDVLDADNPQTADSAAAEDIDAAAEAETRVDGKVDAEVEIESAAEAEAEAGIDLIENGLDSVDSDAALASDSIAASAEALDSILEEYPTITVDSSEPKSPPASTETESDPDPADPGLSELLQAMDTFPAAADEESVDAPTPEDPGLTAVAADAADDEPVETLAQETIVVDTDEINPVQIDSSQWSLVDYSLDDIADAPVDEGHASAAVTPGAAAAEALASREFGIELVDPIEYLAPDSPTDRGEELFAAPELMSMQEALAPQVDDDDANPSTVADSARSRLPRLVVLGASIGGPDAVREFLSALPPRIPATFVLVQHLGSEFVDLMINQLGKSSALPVRVPAHAERALAGEVLVVPRGRQMLISLDGEVELRELPETSAHDPSINLTMAMAAENFGTDALAIVFSGMANDAVSGALEIAANGGSVWVQDPEHCVVSSMVDAVTATGVVRFSGTPSALAQHLIDEFGTETPA